MAWLMGLHIIALVVWSASLLYMPALYSVDVRHRNRATLRRLRIMTRFAYLGIGSPAAVVTIVTGGLLVYQTGASGDWLAAKLTVVTFMVVFHSYCGHLLAQLGHEGPRKKNRHFSSLWLVCTPVLLIPVVVWLVLAKPVLVS